MEVRLAEHVAWREINGETFIIDLRTKMMYGLNATAGRVWKAIDDERQADDIARDLTVHASGNGSHEWARQAVGSFFHELLELGLVTGEQEEPGVATAQDPAHAGLAAPQVVWREELRAFGFSCAFQPGTSPACNQVPQS
jgi:hypothetical protein